VDPRRSEGQAAKRESREGRGQASKGGEEKLTDKACKTCRMISAGPVCPNCKQTIFSDDWTGLVVVIDPANSEVARLMGIKVPGRFAVRVR
jgi:DNA-directed RNA polymerase subunit E"